MKSRLSGGPSGSAGSPATGEERRRWALSLPRRRVVAARGCPGRCVDGAMM
jgi:hypothetical protein